MNNILLVDDNKKIRKLMEIYLVKDGFNVFHGENGEDALDVLDHTYKDNYPDKKMGFELGADDYMTKPIDMEEMILRVRALLRRSKISLDKCIKIGDILLDYESMEVRTNLETVLLPKKEFYLLYKPLSYPKKIFTRRELMDDIWGIHK